METVHFYNVDLNWENDRKGLMSSPVLNSSIEVATPPEFPKGWKEYGPRNIYWWLQLTAAS